MTSEDIGHRIYWTDASRVAHYYDDCPSLRLEISRGRRAREREWRDLPPLNFCRMCTRLDVHGHSERIRARNAAAEGGAADGR